MPGSEAVSDDQPSGRAWPMLRVVQWLTIATLVVVSEATAWSGHGSASYMADGAALVAYLGFRRLRRVSGRPR